jgi:hypothetical protein
MYDNALALVRNLDEADQRRLTIVQFLAQAARWDELREVLRGVKSPKRHATSRGLPLPRWKTKTRC